MQLQISADSSSKVNNDTHLEIIVRWEKIYLELPHLWKFLALFSTPLLLYAIANLHQCQWRDEQNKILHQLKLKYILSSFISSFWNISHNVSGSRRVLDGCHEISSSRHPVLFRGTLTRYDRQPDAVEIAILAPKLRKHVSFSFSCRQISTRPRFFTT